MAETRDRNLVSSATRLLRHTPGTLESLASNGGYRHASKHALQHYTSGAIFTFIPKNACTSLRVSLALANGAIADDSQWTWVHKNNSTFSADFPALARATSTAVILRCPFARLASVFLDKIVSRTSELWALRGQTGDMLDPDELTFRSFVQTISNPKLLRSNIHWQPQESFLVYAQYDHVFGMHQISEFSEHFENTTGQPFVDARNLTQHTTSQFKRLAGANHADTPLPKLTFEKAKGALPRAQDLYDDQIRTLVRKTYDADFRLYDELIGSEGLLFKP